MEKQNLSFGKANNPFIDWPYRFFAMWAAGIIPPIIFILQLAILWVFGLQNEPLLWVMLYLMTGWVMFVHTGKFWNRERTWWQSFKTYGFFWMIFTFFFIAVMFIKDHFRMSP